MASSTSQSLSMAGWLQGTARPADIITLAAILPLVVYPFLRTAPYVRPSKDDKITDTSNTTTKPTTTVAILKALASEYENEPTATLLGAVFHMYALQVAAMYLPAVLFYLFSSATSSSSASHHIPPVWVFALTTVVLSVSYKAGIEVEDEKSDPKRADFSLGEEAIEAWLFYVLFRLGLRANRFTSYYFGCATLSLPSILYTMALSSGLFACYLNDKLVGPFLDGKIQTLLYRFFTYRLDCWSLVFLGRSTGCCTAVATTCDKCVGRNACKEEYRRACAAVLEFLFYGSPLFLVGYYWYIVLAVGRT